METILKLLVYIVAGFVVVETVIYFISKWFIDYVSPTSDSPDNK